VSKVGLSKEFWSLYWNGVLVQSLKLLNCIQCGFCYHASDIWKEDLKSIYRSWIVFMFQKKIYNSTGPFF
jgi:hypothetical protein